MTMKEFNKLVALANHDPLDDRQISKSDRAAITSILTAMHRRINELEESVELNSIPKDVNMQFYNLRLHVNWLVKDIVYRLGEFESDVYLLEQIIDATPGVVYREEPVV